MPSMEKGQRCEVVFPAAFGLETLGWASFEDFDSPSHGVMLLEEAKGCSETVVPEWT